LPFINLIQDKRLEAKRLDQKSRVMFLAFGSSIAVSILGFGFLAVENFSKRAQADQLSAELQQIAPLQRQIDADTKASQALQPRLTTLQNAQTITASWSHVLEHIAHQTPAEVWLTAINSTAQDPTKPVQATFVGEAVSQAPISEYVFRLQNSQFLDAVNLKYTQEKDLANTKSTDFEIDANVTGTTLEAAPAKDSQAK